MKCCHSIGTGRRVAGFTLIEMLATVAIVAVLAALLFPSLSSYKKAANRTKCTNNLRSIGAVWTSFASDNNGFFPSNNLFYGGDDVKLGNWTLMYGALHNALMPYVNGGGDIFFCPEYKFSKEPKMWKQELARGGAYYISYNMYAGQDYAAAYNDSLGNNLPPAFRLSQASSKVPLLFDDTTSDENFRYSNHYDKSKQLPYGGNALFGDGHVEWRNYPDMIPVLKAGSGFTRYY